MSKLTAMQELIKDLKDCKSENPFIQINTDLIIELAELRLEKEKKQIIEAGDKCISNYLRHEPERHGNKMPSGEQYYNLTFNNK